MIKYSKEHGKEHGNEYGKKHGKEHGKKHDKRGRFTAAHTVLTWCAEYHD